MGDMSPVATGDETYLLLQETWRQLWTQETRIPWPQETNVPRGHRRLLPVATRSKRIRKDTKNCPDQVQNQYQDEPTPPKWTESRRGSI